MDVGFILLQTYLSFRQTEVDSQFRFPPDGDVSVEMKLLFQLQSLVVCVHYPVFLLRSCFTCVCDRETKRWFILFYFIFRMVSSGWTGRFTVLRAGCMPDLSAHVIFISCVFNLHIFTLATETQIGLFDLALTTTVARWISSSHKSDPSLTSERNIRHKKRGKKHL